MKIRVKTSVFFLAAFLGYSNWVLADDSVASLLDSNDCTNQKIVQEIKADFKFRMEGSDKDLEINICDQSSIPNKFIRALAYLKHAQYEKARKSKDETFFNFFNSPQTPYGFLRQRVQEIHFTLNGNCQRPTTAAYVARAIEKTFFVCLAPKLSLTPYFYAVSALHEAKHLDADDLDHVTCTQGTGKGNPASCDEFKEKEGAYFYNAEYPALLSRYGKNIHPATKAYARAAAIYSNLNNFNEVPKIKTTSAVVLKQTNGDLSTFDLSKNFKVLSNIQNQKIFSQTNGSFNIYSDDQRLFAGWNPYDGLTAPSGRIATDYNNSDYKSRGLIQDIFYGDYSYGMIRSNQLSLSLNFNYQTKQFAKEADMKAPFQKAKRFLNPALCNGDKNNLYIQTEDQKVYEASLDAKKEIQFKELKNCKTQFLNRAHLNESDVGLDTNGKLLQLIKGEWQVIPDLINKRFDYMSGPLSVYDFFL